VSHMSALEVEIFQLFSADAHDIVQYVAVRSYGRYNNFLCQHGALCLPGPHIQGTFIGRQP